MTSRRHVQPGWAARSRCPLRGSRGGQCVGDGWARRAPGSGGRALGALQDHDPLTEGLSLLDFLRNLLIRSQQRAL